MARSAAQKRDLMAIAEVAPSPKAPSARSSPAMIEIPGLRDFAALSEGVKRLAAMALVQLTPMKATILDLFVAHGATGKCPANFTGIEGEATASMQLRAKARNMPLAPETVTLLVEAGVAVDRAVIQPRTYIVNPAYADDAAMMKRAGQALGAARLPNDFIQRQPEVAYDIVGETALDDIFERYGKTNPAKARELLDAAAYPICVPKWEGDDRDVADLVRDEFLADARLPAAERATVRAKEIEKEAERLRYRPPAPANDA